MTEQQLRSLIRLILESSSHNRDYDDSEKDKEIKKPKKLLMEPDTVKDRDSAKRRESSTVGGSLAGAPSDATASDGGADAGDGGGIDSGDGCEDVGDCKDDNEENERRDLHLKKEVSGAAAIGGGPAMPLGVGPHYPAPDSPAVKRIKKQIDVVGRAYGGAKPTKKRKK